MEEIFPGYRPFVLPTHFHKWVGEPDYAPARPAPTRLVRFPNSLGCELGERRACTRGIFLPWQIVAKIFIESGQLRTELACSTRDLTLPIDQPRASSLGAAVELLFSLPLIWAFSSSRLGFSQLYFQSDFFHICSVGFLSHLSGYFFHVYFPPLKLHASPFLPFGTSLPLIWALLFQSLRHL